MVLCVICYIWLWYDQVLLSWNFSTKAFIWGVTLGISFLLRITSTDSICATYYTKVTNCDCCNKGDHQTWKMSNFLHGWKFQSKCLPQKRVNFRQNLFFDEARKSSFLIIYSVSRWKTLAVEWHWWLYLPQPSGHFRFCLVCQCGEVPSSPA